MTKKKLSVTVLGLGYIGLPTALLIADQGISVHGYDISEQRRSVLMSEKLPFEENGLPELFSKAMKKKSFSVTEKIESGDFYIIAVPTPQENGKADLSFVKHALNAIKDVFKTGQTIVVESTIGPRDCVDELIPQIEGWGIPYHFAHCPERAIPGNTLSEMVNNDRIIGGDTQKSAKIVSELYRKFVKGPIHLTDTIVAASCKVMENTYRAVNIALANEFALLAEELDFNVWEAIELANKHPRVQIHQPGPGVGGHCIPIDPWFFVGASKEVKVIETALRKNDSMHKHVAQQIAKTIQEEKIENPVIAILGYAYKKNVDDARETPSESLRKVLSRQYSVQITDPFVERPFIQPEDEVLATSNVWVLMTDHDHYQKLNLKKYPHVKYIYDARNALTAEQIKGFAGIHHTLGRKNS